MLKQVLQQDVKLNSSDFQALSAILQPINIEDFYKTYWNKQYLHIKGKDKDYKHLMSWPILADMLNKTNIWSQTSLQMVLDCQPIPPQKYSQPQINRDQQRTLQPEAEKVKLLFQNGASLVLNDIDCLHTPIRELSCLLESALKAKVQVNLYASQQQRQAFPAHFDTHDVFAFHTEGVKEWVIYEGCIDNPIPHPQFKNIPQETHQKLKKQPLARVIMEPGDCLYIPRGQYHEACATSGKSLHITFGLTYPIGLDVLSLLFEQAAKTPFFRENLHNLSPEQMVKEVTNLLHSTAFQQTLNQFRQQFGYKRGGFDGFFEQE